MHLSNKVNICTVIQSYINEDMCEMYACHVQCHAPLYHAMARSLSCPPTRLRLLRRKLSLRNTIPIIGSTANLRTKILDFRGIDSSRILIVRGGILKSIGNFPERLSQQILVGIILVGRLGVVIHKLRSGFRPERFPLPSNTRSSLIMRTTCEHQYHGKSCG